MAAIYLRTIFLYVFLIAVMRLTGKRQIGQLQLSELITALLLSQLASQPLINESIPLVYAIVPILLLVSIEIILSYLSTKSNLMKKILESPPSIIIRKGIVNQKEMARVRLSVEELMCELRLKGVSSLSEVDYAILEQNGQISVLTNDANTPVKQKDMGIKGDGAGLSRPILIDGHINETVQKEAGKSDAWVREELAKRRITDARDVFLLTVDDRGATEIIRKDKGGKNA